MKKFAFIVAAMLICAGSVEIFANISTTQTEQVKIKRECRNCKRKGYIYKDGVKETCPECNGTGWISIR